MSRFSNLGLDNTPPAPVAPAIPGVTVQEGAKAKADAEQKMVRDAFGIAVDETAQFYVNGTKMLECGEATARGLRSEWENLPTVGESMGKLEGLVKAEKREDFTAKVRDLRIDTNGLLQGANGGIVLTENAFGQLTANFRGEGAKNTPTRLRPNFNLWAGKSEKNVMLRTRNPQEGGIRTAFACVGSRYGAYDVDNIARELTKRMPKDAHGTFLYQDARASIDVSLAPTFDDAGEVGVGRVHRVHCLVDAADDGTGSLSIRYAAERIRCINCTIIQDERVTFKRRHVGDVAEIFTAALGNAGLAMEIFAGAWREANTKSIVDKNDGTPLGAEETFKRLIAHGYVHLPWVKDADLLGRLMGAFEKEPGKGAAAINMAITRMAHEGAKDWKSPWYVQSLEEQAGALLFQHVYVLPKLSAEQAEAFN